MKNNKENNNAKMWTVHKWLFMPCVIKPNISQIFSYTMPKMFAA